MGCILNHVVGGATMWKLANYVLMHALVCCPTALFLSTPLWEARYLGALPIAFGTFLVTKGRMDAQRRKEAGLEP